MFDLIPRALAEEAVVQAEPGWFEAALARFGDLGATGWITIITLIVLAAVMIMMSVTRKVWTAKSLAYAAMCVALSFVLSYIKLFEMPQGGSVTLCSMLPIMLFAAAYGVGPGLLVGAVYGLLQYLQGGWFVHPIQFLLDYPLAFALIGLAGLYRVMPREWSKWSLYAAMILGAIGRAFSATLAGILYWETAPWASLVYNGTYLIPDT
ncbi:MAG: energy-coupled thiamine transporter ThiT, partial [Clostridia bacterium]|nr:energy-coupled thiamine transporter ThiT [Clostridia bacterium]